MGRRRTRAFVGIALLLGGCRLFVSLDDLGGGPAPEDGGSSEAAADVVTAADATDTATADTNEVFDGGADVQDARGTSDRVIACQATATCAVSHQACCIVYGGAADYCFDAAVPSDCAFGNSFVVARPCDDDKDCADLGKPGTVCCGSTVSSDGTGGYTTIECVPPAACTGGNRVRLCDSFEKACPGGGTCKSSTNSVNAWECL